MMNGYNGWGKSLTGQRKGYFDTWEIYTSFLNRFNRLYRFRIFMVIIMTIKNNKIIKRFYRKDIKIKYRFLFYDNNMLMK
jgi:hypothetical protein